MSSWVRATYGPGPKALHKMRSKETQLSGSTQVHLDYPRRHCHCLATKHRGANYYHACFKGAAATALTAGAAESAISNYVCKYINSFCDQGATDTSNATT